MNARKRRESESQLIDRLVLGLPPSQELLRRMKAMLADGLTCREIGEKFGMSMDAVQHRLWRARRSRMAK